MTDLAPARLPPAGKLMVLVVDDTDALRSLLTVALQSAGYHVVAAPNGYAGLALAREARPDVVILDLGLPDLDGLEVLTALKRDPVTAAAPVLVVSARTDPSVISSSLDRGAHDHVAKPFRMSELMARVEAAARVKREHDRLEEARLALRGQVDFIEAYLDTIESAVVVLDPAGAIVRFNRSAQRLSGYTEAEVAGHSFWDTPLLLKEDREAIRQAYLGHASGDPSRQLARIETRWQARDGGIRVIAWSNTVLFDDEGNFAFGVGTGTDITNLRDADRRLHACLDVMPDAIAILDAIRAPGGVINDFQVRYLNRAAEMIFPPAMLESASAGGARQFMSDQTFALMTDVVDRSVTRMERTSTEFEGVTMTVEYTGAPFGDGIVLGLRDVTELQVAHDRLAWAASHDALTGLADRRLLSDRLHHALAQRPTEPTELIGVLFVDLDQFKAINDDLGHAAGDTALQAIARALDAASRPGDTVARFGGDEFVIVAERMGTEAEVRAMADRFAEAVRSVEVHGRRLNATFGHAVARPGDDPDTILRLADQVMYSKKRSREPGNSPP
ncbi:MAG: hypothetical protein NVS3B12_18810 [Acidimicrobiales bacterium]